MSFAEVYFDRDTVRVDLITPQKTYKLSGSHAIDFIKKFYGGKVLKVSTNEQRGEASFRYPNCQLIINKYKNMQRDHRMQEILSPIFKKGLLFEERQELSKTKNSKVKRKNKHVGLRISAGSIAATALLAFVLNLPRTEIYVDNFSDHTVINRLNTSSPNEESPRIIYEGAEEEYEEVNIEEKAFIEYADRTGSEKARNASANYRDVISRYATIYGLDPNLVLALATQERGVHSSVIDHGGAIGLMQVQVGVWENQNLTAYNFETNSYETITVDRNKLSDLDYNVKVGCMIFQTALKQMSYNVLAGLQNYNMGYGNMQKVLNNYCFESGKNKEEVLSDQYDTGWLPYRSLVSQGDSSYIENVLSYYAPSCQIQATKPDGTIVCVNVENREMQKIY